MLFKSSEKTEAVTTLCCNNTTVFVLYAEHWWVLWKIGQVFKTRSCMILFFKNQMFLLCLKSVQTNDCVRSPREHQMQNLKGISQTAYKRILQRPQVNATTTRKSAYVST